MDKTCTHGRRAKNFLWSWNIYINGSWTKDYGCDLWKQLVILRTRRIHLVRMYKSNLDALFLRLMFLHSIFMRLSMNAQVICKYICVCLCFFYFFFCLRICVCIFWLCVCVFVHQGGSLFLYVQLDLGYPTTSYPNISILSSLAAYDVYFHSFPLKSCSKQKQSVRYLFYFILYPFHITDNLLQIQ